MKKLLVSDRNEHRSKGLVARIANATLIAVAFFAVASQFVMAQAPRIPTPGTGGNFGDIQVDGDRVKLLTVTDGGVQGKVRIKLNADGSWWKMLRVFDKNGRASFIEQENGKYINQKEVIEIDSGNLDNTFKLEFWKAKLLGAHTYIMTEIYRKQDFDGRVVTFVWKEGLESDDSDLSEDVTAPINETLKIDGKNVSIVSAGGGRSGYATIQFRTDVDWWTALKTFDRNGAAKLIEKNDGKYQPTTRTLQLPLSALPSAVKLEFWTAKLLGVRTHMASKKLIRERFAGRIVTVTWGSPAAPINETVTIEGKKVTIKSTDGGTSGNVTFVFQTGLDWWTALKFFDRAGKAKLITKVNGKYSPATKTLTVPISSLSGTTKLELWTAKAFGVHTHMASKAFVSERFDGRTVTINWPK